MWKWFVVLLVLAGLGISPGCSKTEIHEIKLGAILPLTGEAAPYGTALKKGMDLAIEQINAKGGISGKRLIVVFEDDRNLPQDGVTAFNKLRSVDKVPMVMGAMFSAVTLAIAPIAEKDKIVLLSPTSSDVSLTSAGDYIFRIYPSDSYDGKFLGDFAFDRLRVRKVAVISMQTSSTIAVSQLFKKVYEGKGGTVVSQETFREGTTDFRAALTKIKQQQQDLVFLPAALREAALILRQAKELGVTSQFLGISTLFDPKLIELAGNAAEGLLFSSPVFDAASSAPEIRTFAEAYKGKYKADPDILGAYGYDTVNISVAALSSASSGQATSEAIKDALYKIKEYKGVTGLMSFDRNGDVTKELRIMKVSARKFVPYSQN
jgi:branched-chain amino acid transport system substrate-binding protein